MEPRVLRWGRCLLAPSVSLLVALGTAHCLAAQEECEECRVGFADPGTCLPSELRHRFAVGDPTRVPRPPGAIEGPADRGDAPVRDAPRGTGGAQVDHQANAEIGEGREVVVACAGEVAAPVDEAGADLLLTAILVLTAIGLADLFAQLIAKADDDARRTRLREEALSRAEVMLAIHRLFRARCGDAEAYLRAGGVAAASIAALRRRMLDGASRTT